MVHVDATGKATFQFLHSISAPVFLVGDFCHWQSDHLPMRRVSEHEWVLMMRLPPGNYEFRYFAAGAWYTDYAAFGLNCNPFDAFNSVLRIPKVKRPAREPAEVRRRARPEAVARSA